VTVRFLAVELIETMQRQTINTMADPMAFAIATCWNRQLRDRKTSNVIGLKLRLESLPRRWRGVSSRITRSLTGIRELA